MITAFIAGFTLGLSLIVAIGAQNAFILRQGLKNEHVFAVCLTCVISDVILILAGIYVFKYAAEYIPMMVPYITLGGAIYLAFYGVRNLISAWRLTDSLVPKKGESPKYVGTTIAKCLALTWSNPHVYLDTVVLIGSVSTSFEKQQHFFGGGAILASLLFLFSLGYFSKLLSLILSRKISWRILDILVGITMIILSLKLFISVLF